MDRSGRVPLFSRCFRDGGARRVVGSRGATSCDARGRGVTRGSVRSVGGPRGRHIARARAHGSSALGSRVGKHPAPSPRLVGSSSVRYRLVWVAGCARRLGSIPEAPRAPSRARRGGNGTGRAGQPRRERPSRPASPMADADVGRHSPRFFTPRHFSSQAAGSSRGEAVGAKRAASQMTDDEHNDRVRKILSLVKVLLTGTRPSNAPARDPSARPATTC